MWNACIGCDIFLAIEYFLAFFYCGEIDIRFTLLTILFNFNLLAMPQDLWDLTSQTRDQIQDWNLGHHQWKHGILTTRLPDNSLTILKCPIQWH